MFIVYFSVQLDYNCTGMVRTILFLTDGPEYPHEGCKQLFFLYLTYESKKKAQKKEIIKNQGFLSSIYFSFYVSSTIHTS